MHRYPEGTVATADDLRTSRMHTVLKSESSEDYASIWHALSLAAAAALEEGRPAEAKALWIVADAASMVLRPKSRNEPFAPMAVFGNRRSAVASDFSPADIGIFAAVAAEVSENHVRARLSDIVWLCGNPPKVNFALIAIDAYRAIPLTADSWVPDARDCWERAIVLCQQLRAGAGSRLDEMEAALFTIFDKNIGTDGFFALSVSRLLFENKIAQSHGREIGDRLADRGKALAQTNSYEAREYLETAALWYGRFQEQALQLDMICEVAETWSREAASRASADQPSNMAAATFYENAIHTLRRVPRNLRADRAVDQRLAELYDHLKQARMASHDEMKPVSSNPIDISHLVEGAQAAVQGKDLPDALLAFCNIHHGAHAAKLKELAMRMLREHPLRALFNLTHLSRDGRVIAKCPSVDFGSAESEKYQITLWAEMVKYYSIEIDVIVWGQLLPALDVLSLEHRVREVELEYMLRNSPVVPHGRAALFAKGLFAGFESDLTSALHLLVPQVENLVRWHLKAAGVQTTTLSTAGIETENGLSTLMDLPEVVPIFGDDLAFELKALFCDAFGPNLRNEVAHGLLDAESCHTTKTLYAWWFVLRITLNGFWSAAHKSQNSPPSEEVPLRGEGTSEA